MATPSILTYIVPKQLDSNYQKANVYPCDVDDNYVVMVVKNSL